METGFITGEQGKGAGLVGHGDERHSELNADIEADKLFLQLGLLAYHFEVKHSGLNGHESADAPLGAGDLVDHARFHAIGGSIERLEFGGHAFELFRIFAAEKKGIVRGKTVLDRVLRRYGPRFSGFRAMGFCAVGSSGIGLQLRYRYHVTSPGLSLLPRFMGNGVRILYIDKK